MRRSQLPRDVGGNQMRIDLRALDLLDVDMDVLAVATHQIVAKLVHFGTLPADDDSRPT